MSEHLGICVAPVVVYSVLYWQRNGRSQRLSHETTLVTQDATTTSLDFFCLVILGVLIELDQSFIYLDYNLIGF